VAGLGAGAAAPGGAVRAAECQRPLQNAFRGSLYSLVNSLELLVVYYFHHHSWPISTSGTSLSSALRGTPSSPASPSSGASGRPTGSNQRTLDFSPKTPSSPAQQEGGASILIPLRRSIGVPPFDILCSWSEHMRTYEGSRIEGYTSIYGNNSRRAGDI